MTRSQLRPSGIVKMETRGSEAVRRKDDTQEEEMKGNDVLKENGASYEDEVTRSEVLRQEGGMLEMVAVRVVRMNDMQR